jgi:hypothetical protein
LLESDVLDFLEDLVFLFSGILPLLHQDWLWLAPDA